MNRKKGLFGLSAAAGVVAASSLLAFAGTGSAATSNSAAAFGVQSSGAEPHAARAVRVDDDGGDAHGLGQHQGRLRQGRRCDRHHQPGQVQCDRRLGFSWGYGTVTRRPCHHDLQQRQGDRDHRRRHAVGAQRHLQRRQDGHLHRWHRHRSTLPTAVPAAPAPTACRSGRAPTASRSPVPPVRRRRRRPTRRRRARRRATTSTPTSTSTSDGDRHEHADLVRDEHADRDRDRHVDEHPDGDQHADGPAERRPDPDPDRDEPPGHGLNPGPTRGLLRQHRHVVQVNAEPAPSPADRGRRRFVVRRQGVGRAGAPGQVSAAASAGRRRGG